MSLIPLTVEERCEELIRQCLIELIDDVKKELHDEILDYEYSTKIDKDVVKYEVTLYVKLREPQCLWYEGVDENFASALSQSEEELSEEEIEKEYQEYVKETVNEFDSEYSNPPFKFEFEDTSRKVRIDTYLVDDGYKRCWYDVLAVTYRNQLAIDFTEQFLDEPDKLIEKFLQYDKPIVTATIHEFKDLIKPLLP